MTPRRTLLHVFPTFNVGGAQMRFVQLANHFGCDYRHRIVAMDGGAAAFDRLKPGLDAALLEVPVRRQSMFGNLGTVRRVLKTLRPDLLVTSNWGSIDWALANLDGLVPHLHMEDGFGPEETVTQLPRRVWTRRLALRRSTVMLPSQTLFALARDCWRLPRRRLTHVPNGIDCLRFDCGADLAYAAAFGLEPGTPVIGTVAALRAEKNLTRLIEAFAQLVRHRPARLVIIGDGPERTALAGRAAALGVEEQVIFTGACATPEKLLALFTVFALSSDTEQMPLSVLEAMAAGRPLVATAVGDVPVMVSDLNRPFVVGKDAGLLAGALLTLLDDPERARAVGDANRLRAREVYDQRLMFDAYRQLYGPPAKIAGL